MRQKVSISLVGLSAIAIAMILIIRLSSPAFGESRSSDEKIKSSNSKATSKVLYIASYHTKNPWSGGIKSAIESVLEPRKDVQLKVFNMDTMGIRSEDIKEKAALQAKMMIDSWKPDVVIASDDNASKYLIAHYFMDSDLPFVFCGVNWEASQYGFPSKNVTGMIEVQLIDQLVAYLTPYAKGDKVGSLRGNTMTNQIEAEHFEKQLGKQIKTSFVDNISQWKTQFRKLQNEVDMLLLGDIDTIDLGEESKTDVENFIFKNTKIPTGHWDAWFSRNALITLATIPQEQGQYAAQTALEILEGRSPQKIPLVKNKKAKIFLNMKLAKKMGIIFPMDLINSSQLIAAD